MPARARVTLLLVAAGLLLSGCAANQTRQLHYTIAEAPGRPFPERLLLLPLDVKAHELTAGGVSEEVPAWSEQARANVGRALERFAADDGRLAIVPLGELPDAQRTTVAEHVALYDVVAGSAFALTHTGGEAWRHKREHFDYGIGPGMAFLHGRDGADAALLVVGEDYISSRGRKVAAVAAAFLGVMIPVGYSYLTAGIVDLRTGDLLWFDIAYSYADKDLRRYEDVAALLGEVLASLPREAASPAGAASR